MANISAIILTKNEQDNLDSCLSHLKFCKEIIIVDDDSVDKTLKIAKSYRARIFKRKLNSDFAAQRNFALSKASSKWILFIDPDEIVTKRLAEEIQEAINKSFNGFVVKRRDNWLGKNMQGGEVGNICLARLVRAEKGRWVRSVHEHLLIDGRVGRLTNILLHKPHPNIASFVDSINFYSDIHGKENQKENKESSFFRIVIFPLGKFIQNFIFKKGYKDGSHGFVHATLMSFHSFLSWSKLWHQNYS